MAKTSLIITTTQTTGGAKVLQKTLTDINPAATNDKLVAFARALNGLTTNTYGETNRVQKVNVDTEEIPSSAQQQKTQATITAPATVPKDGEPHISYTSDYTGNIFVSTNNGDALMSIMQSGTPTSLYLSGFKANDTITVMIPETENYTSATAQIVTTA